MRRRRPCPELCERDHVRIRGLVRTLWVQQVGIHCLNRRANLLNFGRQRNEETGVALGPGLQSWSPYRNGVVLSQETSAAEKRKPARDHYIPDVCRELGVPCIQPTGTYAARTMGVVEGSGLPSSKQWRPNAKSSAQQNTLARRP